MKGRKRRAFLLRVEDNADRQQYCMGIIQMVRPPDISGRPAGGGEPRDCTYETLGKQTTDAAACEGHMLSMTDSLEEARTYMFMTFTLLHFVALQPYV